MKLTTPPVLKVHAPALLLASYENTPVLTELVGPFSTINEPVPPVLPTFNLNELSTPL